MTARLLPYGPGGWLVEVDPDEVVGYAAAIHAFAHPGVAEVVSAARTVLVRVADPGALGAVGDVLAGLAPMPAEPAATAAAVLIPVVYDGEDLAAVAAARALTPQEVIARHTAATYTCAFCGFAPGFAYLAGLDPALGAQTPRDAPDPSAGRCRRHRRAVLGGVPVGLAGRLAPARTHERGPVGPGAHTAGPRHARGEGAVHRGRSVTELIVDAAGWATTIQDAGRLGYADLGVSPSGPLDGPTSDLLNRLVGNPPDSAVLETLGGLRMRATAAVILATSATLAPVAITAGDAVDVAPASGALWGYVAVRGGLDVAPVLGSRSQDSRSGLGPPAVVDGTRLRVGADSGRPIVVDQAPRQVRERPLDLWPGPRQDWFADDALKTLVTAAWTVSTDVSRVGARLQGPVLRRLRHGELDSEGLLTGAIQVPPDGQPVVMLNDHPTTGGYPVLAVVDPASLPALAQSRPGTALRFRLVH